MSFAAAQYRQARVSTLSPAQILVSLYEGAIRFLREALEKGAAGDVAGRGAALGRAQAIVVELDATLDHERAPELCAHLSSLYDFVLHCVREATIHADAERVRPAIATLETLLSAWRQIARAEGAPTASRTP